MADLFARISSQASAAQAQAATMSFSTVRGTAGVLPTPSSCASRSINFASGANTAGCTFSPQGDDIKPYKDCCKDAPLLSYSDGCGFYCKAQDQSLRTLQQCLSRIRDTGSISCQSNSNSGGGSGVSQFSSGGGGNVNIGGSSSSSGNFAGFPDQNNDDFEDEFFNDDNNDSQGGGSAVVASTAAVAGPGQTAIARTSNGPNGASGTGTTINGSSPTDDPTIGGGNDDDDDNNDDDNDDDSQGGGSAVVASTQAVAGPGQTAVASTSAGPDGADGFGTTVGGVAAPTGFAANPSGGAPFPQGNSTGSFIASNTPAGSPTGTAPIESQSFTGAATAVKAPAGGISKGGLLTVGLLVFGTFAGAML